MTERDDLAAKLFPRKWIAVATKTGASKKRTQLRQRAEQQQRMHELATTRASCATCWALRRDVGGMKGLFCDAESGGGAYTRTTADGLCLRYEKKEKAV